MKQIGIREVLILAGMCFAALGVGYLIDTQAHSSNYEQLLEIAREQAKQRSTPPSSEQALDSINEPENPAPGNSQ